MLLPLLSFIMWNQCVGRSRRAPDSCVLEDEKEIVVRLQIHKGIHFHIPYQDIIGKLDARILRCNIHRPLCGTAPELKGTNRRKRLGSSILAMERNCYKPRKDVNGGS